jgi:hypothetical protein
LSGAKKCIEPPFPFEHPVALPNSHALVHGHSDGERVPVIAVGGDHVVVLAEERNRADGDGFLTDVEVEKATHALLLIPVQRGLLEAADAQHFPQKTNLVVSGERLVDRR